MSEELADSIFAIEKRLDAFDERQKKITEIFDKNTNAMTLRLQTLEQETAEKLRRIDVRLHNSEAAQKPPERRWRRLRKVVAAAAVIAVIAAGVASMFITLPMNEVFCHKFGGQTVRTEDGRFACWIDLD